METDDRERTREAAERKFAVMWDRKLRKEPAWRRYRDAFAPGRGVFSVSETSDNKRRRPVRRSGALAKILEESAAGMQSGLASPGRSWFTLALSDARLGTIESVKAWLGQCEEIMAAAMLATNFYDSFVSMQEEQLCFGTAAMFIEEDDIDSFICRTLTIGEYAIDTDRLGRVNRFARVMRYTASQLMEEFGLDALPETIARRLRDRETRGGSEEYEVRHLIQPNEKYQVDELGPPGMAYQSLWWMPGYDRPSFLRVGGYEEFPVVVGRWKTVGSDIYGSMHPGETALDDAETMRDIEFDARRALEHAVTPALIAPDTLKDLLRLKPGGVTWYQPAAAGGAPPVISSLYQAVFDFQAAEAKIDMLRSQIERAFYVDLFRMWSAMRRQGITATQANYEETEKAYILAPVTMRQTSEVLDRCIIRFFNIMQKQGRFPPAPPEMKDVFFRIEYVSEFALLQKRSMREGIEALLLIAGQVAQLQAAAGKAPEVLDRIDGDDVIEVISEMYGIKAGIVLGDDAAAEIRGERARAAEAQQRQAQMMSMAEQVPAGAKAAKDLSETKIGGTSALEMLMSRGTGAAAGMGMGGGNAGG